MRDQARIDALRVELIAKKEMLSNIEGGGAAHGDLFETRGWGIERRIVRISAELHELQADERLSHSRNAASAALTPLCRPDVTFAG